MKVLTRVCVVVFTGRVNFHSLLARNVRGGRSLGFPSPPSSPESCISSTFQGLYDEHESSMDELGGFEPTDTTGFIQIESIRIKKYLYLYSGT